MGLAKSACEVCGFADLRVIHRHHIIPQCDPRCHNRKSNLACLCPNCHSLVHAGEIVILGVYDSTNGRCLVWHRRDEEPPLPESAWLVRDNRLVLTIGGSSDDLASGQP